MGARGISIDGFAGGGGAGEGYKKAFGKSPDLALNHDNGAITMYKKNHPKSKTMREDIRKVNIVAAVAGRKVWHIHLSPDCRHFSNAKGSKPVNRRIRSLPNIAPKWLKLFLPDLFTLENVGEFRKWGPCVIKRDEQGKPMRCAKGRLVWIPDKTREGKYFNSWVRSIERLGYVVEWRMLTAADYGEPTIRRRLYLVARRDGKPIRWPARSHGKGTSNPWKAIWPCLEWKAPVPSVFGRKKELVDPTKRRIARGLIAELRSENPFVMNIEKGERVETAQGLETAADGTLAIPTLPHIGNGEREGQRPRFQRVTAPLSTVTATGHKHLVIGRVLKAYTTDHDTASCAAPAPTVTAKDHNQLMTASLLGIDHRGSGDSAAWSVKNPLTTVTAEARHALAGGTLILARGIQLFGTAKSGPSLNEPAHAVTGQGNHAGLAVATLQQYYSGGSQNCDLDAPAPVATTKDRMSLVSATLGGDLAGAVRVAQFLLEYGENVPVMWLEVEGQDHMLPVVGIWVNGSLYLVVDIGMRMFFPRELARANGFPDSYILTGTKTNQTARIGNCVCPGVQCAILKANAGTGPVADEEPYLFRVAA